MTNIAKNLKRIREEKNLSQNRLAKLSEVSQSHIWYIESGQKTPNINIVIKLSAALEVSVEELIK